MSQFNRRKFLNHLGLGLLPAVVPFNTIEAQAPKNKKKVSPPAPPPIKLYGDGEMFDPGDYLNELQKFHTATNIVRDSYGAGGAVKALEEKFAEISGKEKAIFMPSGTMANQLAIAVLSGENTKIFVQDTSHVFRDEADAAQSVFQKRLMPLAKGSTYFTASQLQTAVESLGEEEVFESGIGAVSIENPVRRADGKIVPLEEIKKIRSYCNSNNIRLHLDGARIFMASAWSGVSVKEYASYFDTVYISLYKYFGAAAGAVLCGSKEIIDKMPHLIKVHGGSMYGNWANAAMALYRVDGFENRLQAAMKASGELFSALNKLAGIRITPLEGGTNLYALKLSNEIDGNKMREILRTEFNIRIPRTNAGHALIAVNETLLYQSTDYVINAFKKSIS